MYSFTEVAILIEAASARNATTSLGPNKGGLLTGSGIRVGAGGVRNAGKVEHLELGVAIGVAHDQLHQEAVELGLG